MSDTTTTTTTTPLTHAQRGALGGAAQHPAKGFGTPEVIARAVATRRRKASERMAEAEARNARVHEITEQYNPPALVVSSMPMVDTVLHADVVTIRVPAPAPDPAMDIQIID